MARVRARAPHRLLRILLLVLGLAMIASIAVILALHRFAAASRPTSLVSDSGEPLATLAEDEVSRGQQFEVRRAIEGTPLFHIRADGIRQDIAGIAHLESVDLELYREDGGVVKVRSNEAEYNQNNYNANLIGQVHLEGNGIDLRTRTLEVSRDGQDLRSPTPVALLFPEANLAGRASALRVRLDQERYLLSDGVHLHSTPNAAFAMKLDAERLTYHRDEGVIRAVGKVHLERLGDSIDAEALTISFADDRRTMKSLRARHGVSAVVVANPGLAADRVELAGEDLIIHFDPQTGLSRRLLLESDRDEARLQRISADSWAQGFEGRQLTVQFTAGVVRTIDGVGSPVVLNETLDMPDGPVMLRQTCSRRIEMQFAALGHATNLRLEGQVELADTEVYIGGGSQADVDFTQELMRVSGPGVSIYHDDGQLSADAFIYHRTKRRLQAQGAVSAVLEERAGQVLATTPLGRGEGPIQVESEKATWYLDPASFVFVDNVRAWRNDNLILADQLRGDETQQQISAGGMVKTLWAPDVVPGGATPAPIEVSAQQMVYDRVHRALIYSDDVEALQAGRRLTCDELTVSLTSADGSAERMNCDGDVLLDDPDLGRKVEGELAVYQLATEVIEVTGDPVTVREADGSTIRCGYFSYNTVNGAIEIRSMPPGAEKQTVRDGPAGELAPGGTPEASAIPDPANTNGNDGASGAPVP